MRPGRRSGGWWDQRGDTVSDHGPLSKRDRTVDLAAPHFRGSLPAPTVGRI
jgi:hypothetical protein